jgi:hypothetical protein
MAVSLKEIDQLNVLSDKLLSVVMNTEVEMPEVAVAALGHVAGMISVELKIPEQQFLFLMHNAYKSVVEIEKSKEVH